MDKVLAMNGVTLSVGLALVAIALVLVCYNKHKLKDGYVLIN